MPRPIGVAALAGGISITPQLPMVQQPELGYDWPGVLVDVVDELGNLLLVEALGLQLGLDLCSLQLTAAPGV
jgi:hypothetical protein